MPYIEKHRRARLIPNCHIAETAGELNFQITTLIIDYLSVVGVSYQTINDVMGALEGAKQEFYRRVAVPYENTKITINGDVYA